MENEKYTPSEKNGKWGCVDNKGNIIVPFMYEAVLPVMRNGQSLMIVKSCSRWGIVDIDNHFIIPPEYQWISPYQNKIEVKRDDKYGLIDFQNRVLVPIKYDYLSLVTGSLFRARKGKEWKKEGIQQ